MVKLSIFLASAFASAYTLNVANIVPVAKVDNLSPLLWTICPFRDSFYLSVNEF